jgi:hypothetical protein
MLSLFNLVFKLLKNDIIIKKIHEIHFYTIIKCELFICEGCFFCQYNIRYNPPPFMSNFNLPHQWLTHCFVKNHLSGGHMPL